jgi:hypothetical protein
MRGQGVQGKPCRRRNFAREKIRQIVGRILRGMLYDANKKNSKVISRSASSAQGQAEPLTQCFIISDPNIFE